MKDTLAGMVERTRATLSTISLGQKVVIGLLLAGLLLGGFYFFSWITTPAQAPLFSNLASKDASAIVDELNAESVPYTLTDGGQTIMVAKDKVYDLRLTMSGKGLPSGQDTGYALLDQQGITTSEFQQQVTYQRAIEGELQKTLEAIQGVRAAVVHVAIPKDQVFVTDQAKPTASVLLDLSPGTQLSGEQIQAVTNLVSSSIQGMDPSQVTVADSTGQVLAAAGSGVNPAAGDTRSQVEKDYENRLAANAQQILDRVVGPNHAAVSVRADVDLSQRQSTSETYTYKPGTPPLSSSGSTEKYNGNGTPVGGVLGPENMPNASAGGGNSSYTKTSATDNNAVDKTTETVVAPPGDLKRLTVSVVMDSAVAGKLNQQQIQSLVGNAVGVDQTRGDAITVATMPFDNSAAKQAAAELAASRAADANAQMWSMIKTGGIAGGILLVILLVWLRSRRREELEDDYEQLELSDDMLAELDRLRISSTREEAKVDNRALELEAAERQRVRGDISAMVSERPDEVAAMLRGWLSESKAS
ncbi:MAG: flagellar basal-body MS-ring/collar protein FliF [Blastococcus sp.]